MTDRYVIANVCLPMRISPDGSINHLTEYMSVSLEPCDKLPDNLPLSNVGAEFSRQLQTILTNYKQPTDPTNTLTVTLQELNARSGKQPIHNTSFKAKRPTYNRHTAKNYPSS